MSTRAERAADWRGVATLLTPLLGLATLATLALSAPATVAFGPMPETHVRATAQRHLSERFDCWSGTERPKAEIPGGVLVTAHGTIVHKSSDAIVGRMLSDFSDPHLVAFCAR